MPIGMCNTINAHACLTKCAPLGRLAGWLADKDQIATGSVVRLLPVSVTVR